MLRCRPSFIDKVIIVDNNSTDNTVDIAKNTEQQLCMKKEEAMDSVI